MKSIVLLCVLLLTLSSCSYNQSSDSQQRDQQEVLLKEATSQVGLPAIHNFRERRILKDLYELRDQEGFVTYTYVWSEMQGKLVFLGESIGYGIPYAAQYTNPQKVERRHSGGELYTLPQADPNGIFSPESAEGTWVMLRNPSTGDIQPVYVEPRIVVSPFRLSL